MLMRGMAWCVIVLAVGLAWGEAPTAEARAKALMTAEVRPAAYVFTGKEFPNFDFEDTRLGAELLGKYTVNTRFYGTNGRRVEAPGDPGRYGAVVEITGEDGTKLTRFARCSRRATAMTRSSRPTGSRARACTSARACPWCRAMREQAWPAGWTPLLQRAGAVRHEGRAGISPFSRRARQTWRRTRG